MWLSFLYCLCWLLLFCTIGYVSITMGPTIPHKTHVSVERAFPTVTLALSPPLPVSPTGRDRTHPPRNLLGLSSPWVSPSLKKAGCSILCSTSASFLEYPGLLVKRSILGCTKVHQLWDNYGLEGFRGRHRWKVKMHENGALGLRLCSLFILKVIFHKGNFTFSWRLCSYIRTQLLVFKEG